MTRQQKMQVIKNLFFAGLGLFSYMMDEREERKKRIRMEKLEEKVLKLEQELYGD